jgi:hypothetical protein
MKSRETKPGASSILLIWRALSKLYPSAEEVLRYLFSVHLFGWRRNYSYRKSFKLPIMANSQITGEDESQQ